MPAPAVEEGIERAAAARRTGRWADAARALDRVSVAARSLDEADPVRARWTVATAESAQMVGGTVRARSLAAEALRTVESHGLVEVLPWALRVMGAVVWRTGDLRGGRVLLERALQRAVAMGDRDGAVRCCVELSHIALDRGLLDDAQEQLWEALGHAGADPWLGLLPAPAIANVLQRRADRDGARACYEEALERARKLGDLLVEAMCLHGLANLALEQGEATAAIERIREAHRGYAQCGYTFGESVCYNALGEAYRMNLDDVRAARAYERAVEAGDRVGHPGLIPRANLAVLRIEAGRMEEARGLIEGVLAAAETRGLRPLVASMHALLLPCVAHDEQLLLHHLLRASDGLVETGIYDRDLAWSAQQAADACTQPRLEVRCRALALHQFEQLGEALAARVERTALANLAREGAPIPAGPFDLISPMGEGAMGEVWRARHRLGFDAAIKVVAAAPRQGRLLDLLEGEARAVAGLDHPNVIRLIDFGTLGPEAQAMRPRLTLGAPWFAMELVGGGSLEDRCGSFPWRRCRELLLDVLDALAHAHSRGVLHLDVKPANVLLTDDAVPVTKLVDFGLTAVIAAQAGKVRVAGTPLYMAPEQFHGEPRAFGPWTDLYALGCVAVHLVTGRAPHQRGSIPEIRDAHLREEPEISLPEGVPEAFAEWARRMMAKDPADRFRFAADAARALLEVGGAPESPRSTEEASAPDRARSGLALFELRRPPLVGRRAERATLARALDEGILTRSPRVVVLSGGSGCGKTALARWLAELAHATGRASTWWAPDAASDPIAALVQDRLGVGGLDPAGARAWIAGQTPTLTEDEVDALVAIGTGDRPEGFRIGHALGALMRVIEEDCADRPVLLHIEGSIERFPAVGRLAEQLLASPLPVVVLLEARPEEQGRSGVSIPGAIEVEVGALRSSEIRELLEAMLPLDVELGVALTERAAGNPRLALHLLGSLVRGDSVVVGSAGVTLRTGVGLDLPDDLATVWRERLDEVLAGLGDDAWVALAAGALLGARVPMADWRAACEQAGIRGLSAVLRRMRQARLAVPTPDRGFAFAPPILRDVVIEVARARGLYEDACRAASSAPGLEADPGRRGELLADGGEYVEAEPLLASGARTAVLTGDVVRARELGRRSADALRAMGAASDDPRWARWHLLHCRIAVEEGNAALGDHHAERLLTLGQRIGDPRLVADGLRWAATVDWIGRRADSALSGFQEALEAYRELDDPLGEAHSHHGIAIVERSRANYPVALEHLEAARVRLAGTDPELASAILCSLGDVHRRVADYASAEAAFREALTLTQGTAAKGALGTVLLGLGELARKRGDLDQAEEHYREALRLRSSGQRLKAASAQLNLALVQMARGRFRDAESALNELIDRLDSNRDSAVVLWARISLVPVFATRGEKAWKAHRALVDAALNAPGLRDPDVAWLLELAGDRAHDAGKLERARTCWAIAVDHWNAVGQPDRARECTAKLEAGEAH